MIRRPPSRPAALAVLLAIVAAGCGLLPMAEDQGHGMTILNLTSKAIRVDYRRVVGAAEMEDLVTEAVPNQRVIIVGLHQAEGKCLRGTLIAIQDGRTIATLAQPCEGTEWVIPAAAGSPGASSTIRARGDALRL